VNIFRANSSAFRVIVTAGLVAIISPLVLAEGSDIALKIVNMKKVIERSSNKQEKAKAWLQIQHLASQCRDQISGSTQKGCTYSCTDGLKMPSGCPGADCLSATVSAGVGLHCSEPDGVLASTEGYEKYLEYWPDGPNADEAEFESTLDRRYGWTFPSTVEEEKVHVTELKAFLKKYPTTPLRQRCEELIDMYSSYIKQGKTPADDGAD